MSGADWGPAHRAMTRADLTTLSTWGIAMSLVFGFLGWVAS